VETAYAVHPHVRNLLVPLAEFHQVLVNEKWKEYGRVLPMLGCAELTIERAERMERKEKGAVEASLAGLFGGKFSVERGRVTVDKTKATDRFPDRGPITEETLRDIYVNAVWAIYDTQLDDLIEKRIKHGVAECHRKFSTSIDSHVNAQLAGEVTTKIGRVGLKVSGNYSEVWVTEVELKVIFHPSTSSSADSKRLDKLRVKAVGERLSALK
jgi:hypothetical protein